MLPSTTFVYPIDHDALRLAIDLKVRWQAFQVTRGSSAIVAEQSCEPDVRRILPQILVDRVQPPLGRQVRKDADLPSDHAVGPHRQIVLRFQVDKPEQRNDKDRGYAGHQQRPAQRSRARELR